ncbi:metallophosphoesterase family protein [uncultured Enterovirga sp.]|uniref:metallophosphoesterase family protein n=1 Tax=uncultured Enterovirga sp. TaxID=2026352 RepID=UPI0035C9B1C7
MSSTRIALVSDIHLSRQRPYFHFNWEILLECLAAERPDLVLVTGDLAIDGAHRSDDLAFARSELARLPCPWLAVPGNHDVGNNVPDLRGEAVITRERLAAYREAIGPDHWVDDRVPGWRLIGLNSLLGGSGFPEESEQAGFLSDTLDGAEGRRVALLYHVPFCDADPADPTLSGAFWHPGNRALLQRPFDEGRIALVLSGHLHESRDRTIGPVRHVWAPGVAFVTDIAGEWRIGWGGRKRVGFGLLTLGPDGAIEVAFREPRAMMNIDIGSWLVDGIGHYAVFAGERPFLGPRVAGEPDRALDPAEAA